eukprot:jgi/Tetstr1/458665/TSEL_045055.t1
MAALFVALDELLPYVPAANKDFTPYLARARNHAEAIDKAFRFRLAFLRRLNEVKRVHGDQGVLDVLRAQHFQPASEHLGSAIFGDLMRDYERRVFEATVASSAKATATGGGSSCRSRTCTRTGGGRGRGREDELGQRTLDLLSSSLTAQTLKSYASRLSQFAEFCHDAENISPLEATTATVVRYVAWIGERGHIGAKSLQPYLSAINTFFELHNLDPIAKDSLHLTSARRGLMLRQRRLEATPLRVPLHADVAYRFVTTAELIVSAPTLEYQHDFRALVASVVNFMFFARGLTGVSCRGAASAANAIGVPLSHIRYQGGWATNSDVVLDYIDPNVLPSPGAWFFFGHIAPLRHFQVQQDSAAVAFPRFGGAFLRNDRDRDGGGNRENLKTARMGRDAVAPRATFAKDATKDFGKGMAKAEAPTVDKAE